MIIELLQFKIHVNNFYVTRKHTQVCKMYIRQMTFQIHKIVELTKYYISFFGLQYSLNMSLYQIRNNNLQNSDLYLNMFLREYIRVIVRLHDIP